MDEDGFTLIEALTSVFLLSLLTVALSNLTQSYLANWERAEAAIAYGKARIQIVHSKGLSESEMRRSELQAFNRFQNSDLLPATPQIDQGPKCVFDHVGKRCR